MVQSLAQDLELRTDNLELAKCFSDSWPIPLGGARGTSC
jgi:hypothetical protein